MRTLIKENNWLPRNTGFSSINDFGWGNGYVLIPEGHPAHGKHYDDIDVDVHGGLTFGRLVDDHMIKQWPELKEEDKGGWLVGFDTAHYDDSLARWPKEAVQAETDRLMEQLKNYHPDDEPVEGDYVKDENGI